MNSHTAHTGLAIMGVASPSVCAEQLARVEAEQASGCDCFIVQEDREALGWYELESGSSIWHSFTEPDGLLQQAELHPSTLNR